jgi:hypothetical protein
MLLAHKAPQCRVARWEASYERFFSNSGRGRDMKVLASLLLGLLSFVTASAQSIAPSSAEPAAVPSPQTAKPPVQLTPEERQSREQWRRKMSAVPLPNKGCFTAVYPGKKWRQVTCVPAPNYPQPPRRGAKPLVVGDGNDVSAMAPSGLISQATGSFETVSGVTGESGTIANSGAAVANAYTLQLNTNFMPGCGGSPNSSCERWQQFVFDNNAHRVYIQYWLIGYDTACPAGGQNINPQATVSGTVTVTVCCPGQNCCPAGQNWMQFSFTGSLEIDCYKDDSVGSVPSPPLPNEPITNLANLSLQGNVSMSGDSVTFTDLNSGMYMVVGDNSVNAANAWNIAEFNVFGDGGNGNGGSEAFFNDGSTIVPRTEILYGGTSAPVCSTEGFSGETNNLSFGPDAPSPSPPGPAMLFIESRAGGAPPNICAAAVSVGNPQLTVEVAPPRIARSNLSGRRRGETVRAGTRQVLP